VADVAVETIAPIRERYLELAADPDHLERVLAEGADRARSTASQTLSDVRRRMGVGPPD
jgi:tryptophanyl-tRNA synthetase